MVPLVCRIKAISSGSGYSSARRRRRSADDNSNLPVAVEISFNKQHLSPAAALASLAVFGRNDQRAGPGVLEIELELVARVSRIERRGSTDSRRRQERGDHLEPVWQSHRDAVARAQTQLAELSRRVVDLLAQFIVGNRGPPPDTTTARCDGLPFSNSRIIGLFRPTSCQPVVIVPFSGPRQAGSLSDGAGAYHRDFALSRIGRFAAASCSPTARLVIEYAPPNNSSTVEKTGGSHEN